MPDIDFCIIGQNFFYEYHTLFDDRNSVLKFYNDDQTKIVYHEEDDDEGIKAWVLIIYIVGGTIIVGSITAIIIIYFCCKRKNAFNQNIILNKELLEMSSIKKGEDYDDEDDYNESNFNQIMSITSDKNHKRINININAKN